jgi:hypothetical protein
MELESLAVNDVTSKDEKSGRSVKLRAITKILVPIFGTVGKTSYEGQVKNLQVQAEKGAVVLKALVIATGTGRLRIDSNYEIADASGKVVDSGPFAVGYVFRGGQRWFTRKIEAVIPKGEYTARISLRSPHLEQEVAGEAKVTWPEMPPLEPQATAKAGGVPQATEKQQGQSGNPTDGSKQTEVQGSTGNK